MDITTVKQKIDLISSVFGEGNLSRSGKNINVFCPKCSKSSKTLKKRKLSICLETGMFHCWVCEASGKNISYFVKNHTNRNEDVEKFFKAFGIAYSNKEEKEKYVVSLPDDFKLLCVDQTLNGKIAKKYLYSRGLSDEDITRYKVGTSNDFKFINRVIFPSFDNNLNLNFFQTRTYDKSQKIKYRNCKANKTEIIFNENMIDWSKTVTLVEGVFDAIKAGDNAICVLGSWIDENHELFKKIVKNKPKVVLAFDPDVKEKTQKLAKILNSYCVEVLIAGDTSKDIGSMTKKEALFYIQNAKHFDVTDGIRYLIKGIKSGSVY